MYWYLHLDGDLPGPYNMAKDDYLLSRAIATGRPVLRLYGWDRLTLSLGRSQKIEGHIDRQSCRDLNLPMIQRSTGGRGVLHGSDLTYSVTAPVGQPLFYGGVMGSYRAISDVFLAFFRRLGHEPTVHAYRGRERAALASPNCFATPSAFEILVDGKKLVGSAQRRRAEGFLQHGSIPLAPQHEILSRIYTDSSAQDIRNQMTDLQTMGVWEVVTRQELRIMLVESFAAVLDVVLTPAPWSPEDERAVIERMTAYPLLWSRPPETEPVGQRRLQAGSSQPSGHHPSAHHARPD